MLAVSPEATQPVIELDYCDADQNPPSVDEVIESTTEVRPRSSLSTPSDDREACQDTARQTTSRPQYAVLTDATWTLREAIDPPADSPLVATERPPLTWWAEYADGPGALVRLSGHAATYSETIAALEVAGFVFDEVPLHRWPGVGGSAIGDPSSPTIVIDTGGDSVMLLSYERDLGQLTAIADSIELVDLPTWVAHGGVIQ